MIKSLYELIDDREEEYKKGTENIVELYGEKLTKAFAFVINSDRDVVWEQFERYGNVSNLVYVIGKIKCDKGDIINTPEGAMKVKVDNYYTAVRLVATIDGIESKEPLELFDEIKLLKSYEEHLSPTESYRLFNDPDFFGTLDSKKFKPYSDKIKEKITESQDKSDDDFKLSALSNQQRESLRLYSLNGKTETKN